MNIKETFLSLTSRTYPHGTESELMHLLPSNLETDEFGNKYFQIGENPTCMFTSHLDTATQANTVVNHIFEGSLIKTDGKSILGADDKAGVAVMLHMMENNVPGLYYFFLGEEVGCVGSRKLSTKCQTNKIEGITKVISFDRRGNDSVITFQASSRCCSDKFGDALAKELNKAETTFSYKTDPTGVYTDSAQFTKIYPECTNISVGYRYEHTYTEQQDIDHLDILAKACVLVDWESLPVDRDPTKYESRYDDDYEWYGGYSRYSNNSYSNSSYSKYVKPQPPAEETIYFMDPDFFTVSSVVVTKYSQKLSKVDFGEERLYDEKYDIMELLSNLEVDYDNVTWDGLKLSVKHTTEAGDHVTDCSRDELVEFLPQLDFWKKELDTYNAASTKEEDTSFYNEYED